jgi:hypothetical protein
MGKIRIRDKHPGSATLPLIREYISFKAFADDVTIVFLFGSVADPGSGAFLTPGIRNRFFPDLGSRTYPKPIFLRAYY